MKNLQNAFSNISYKMSMGRVPTKIFGVSEFFYRKFVEKNFRGRGPQKSTFLSLFSKIDVRNFCQRGKNVFFELPIFLKNRGNGGLFLGCALIIFSHKPSYIRQFLRKKFRGAPPKITPHFLDFSKKSATQKTRFFRGGRNFGHRFLKKGPKTSIFGVPDRENVF